MIEGLGSEPRLHLAQRDFRYASEADIEARLRMSALLLKPDISAPRQEGGIMSALIFGSFLFEVCHHKMLIAVAVDLR